MNGRLPAASVVGDDLPRLAERARRARAQTLRFVAKSEYGFIGSCLSCLDLLVCLAWSSVTRCLDPTGARLVLSKGHAAAALYAALSLEDSRIAALPYADAGSPLQGHPNSRWCRGVLVSTGSLGQGVAVAAGIAIAQRLRSGEARTYVVTGDGELQAGIFWESLLAAIRQPTAPHLTVVVDANGFQSAGPTPDGGHVLAMLQALAPTVVVDGHSIPLIIEALADLHQHAGVNVLWARTRRGAGLAGFDEAWPMSHLPDPGRVDEWLRGLEGTS